jgi:hypothetical protein
MDMERLEYICRPEDEGLEVKTLLRRELRVSTNLCKNTYRSRARHPQVPLDHLPEQAFLNVGTIDDAIAKGERLLAEASTK